MTRTILGPIMLAFIAVCGTALIPVTAGAQSISVDEARAIAKEAYIYGFPLVDSYRIQYSYFVDRGGPEFKVPWNKLSNTARVYTPDDKAIQTPNSDTPYSFLGADLRAEPLVLTVPMIEKERYYSLQFIDMYTFNFAYVGSRTTGNDGGSYLLAGPNWKGETPSGIKSVIRAETEFAFVLYRTQLFNPGDIDNVKKIQAGYKVQPLSQFLGKPAPDAPYAVDFIKPLSPEVERTSPEFFNILNFVLRFWSPSPAETEIMARFPSLGIGPHGIFDGKWKAPPVVQVADGKTLSSTGAVPVTPDNFPRAESDLYFGNIAKDGGLGQFTHRREPAAIDKQTIIRLNRDTLYSAAVFDLDAGPVAITLPDAGKRFMSMQASTRTSTALEATPLPRKRSERAISSQTLRTRTH